MHIDYEDLGQIEEEDRERPPHGAGFVYASLFAIAWVPVLGVIIAIFA